MSSEKQYNGPCFTHICLRPSILRLFHDVHLNVSLRARRPARVSTVARHREGPVQGCDRMVWCRSQRAAGPLRLPHRWHAESGTHVCSSALYDLPELAGEAEAGQEATSYRYKFSSSLSPVIPAKCSVRSPSPFSLSRNGPVGAD